MLMLVVVGTQYDPLLVQLRLIPESADRGYTASTTAQSKQPFSQDEKQQALVQLPELRGNVPDNNRDLYYVTSEQTAGTIKVKEKLDNTDLSYIYPQALTVTTAWDRSGLGATQCLSLN